ncbi:hypothetical protein pb186bvf_003317 [Paramecium bursaria]
MQELYQNWSLSILICLNLENLIISFNLFMDQSNHQPEENIQKMKIKIRYEQFQKDLEYIGLIIKYQIQAIDKRHQENDLQIIQADLLMTQGILDNLKTHFKIIENRQYFKDQQNLDLENVQQEIQLQQRQCVQHNQPFNGLNLRDDVEDNNILVCDQCIRQENDRVITFDQAKLILEKYIGLDQIAEIKQISLKFYDLYLKKYQHFALLVEREIMSDYAQEQLTILQNNMISYKDIINKTFVSKINKIQKELYTPNHIKEIYKRLTRNMDALTQFRDDRNRLYRTAMRYDWKIKDEEIAGRTFKGVLFYSNTNIMIAAQIIDLQHQLNICYAAVKFQKLGDNQNQLYSDHEIIKVFTSGHCSYSSTTFINQQRQERDEQINNFKKEQDTVQGLYDIKFYFIKISKINYLLIQFQTQLILIEIMKNKQISSLQVEVYLNGVGQSAKIDTNLF